MVAVTYIATLLAVLMQGSLAKELPPFFHVCHRSDPTIEECIIHSLEEIRPLLVTGSPEHHIPSVEPLFIQELIKEEASGLTITTTDVTAYGGSNFIVNSVSVDPDDVKITMDVELPQLKIEARYSVHGKLVILQVKGSGLFSGNITNCTSRSVLEGEKYLKDGEEYMRFTSNTMRIHIGSGNVRLEDIFREKILNDAVNDTVNKNLRMFLREMMPIIEKNLASVFLKTANKIVEQFTYDQLFPA